MLKKHSHARPPVFIVGSPRSGTSILTWCLGQHPNLLGVEESNWMSAFAIDVAAAFSRGSIRGERSQLFSMGMSRDHLMEETGRFINDYIASHGSAFAKRLEQQSRSGEPQNNRAFKIIRSETDPKTRWVNGTPEYSFGICGLRKLFPEARFIHLVRDCDRVAASMFHFDQVSGRKLAETEADGYLSWMRYVKPVIAAEEAYGPEVIFRLNYQDMLIEPERTIRRVLDFTGETFSECCLEPLAKKINSSRVALEYVAPTQLAGQPAVEEARALWLTLSESSAPSAAHPAVASQLEEQFEKRVDYIYHLDSYCATIQAGHRALQKEFVERTEWALRLNKGLAEQGARILSLQQELKESAEWAASMVKENAFKNALVVEQQTTCEERTNWAISLQTELEQKAALIFALQTTCDERTNWALSLQAKLEQEREANS